MQFREQEFILKFFNIKCENEKLKTVHLKNFDEHIRSQQKQGKINSIGRTLKNYISKKMNLSN